ncbi:glutaredoxin-C6-like [Wolffia australiana]
MEEVRCRPAGAVATALSIDAAETLETRIRRLIGENPIVIFSRSSCCMCHVMKRLLANLGVHPTVIELEEDEIDGAMATESLFVSGAVSPVVFIGGELVGGLESLMGLHLTGELVPKLAQVGALWP